MICAARSQRSSLPLDPSAAAIDTQKLDGGFTILCAELTEQQADVATHGDGRHAERLGDLGGGSTLAQKLPDLPLSRGERHRAGWKRQPPDRTAPDLVDEGRDQRPCKRRPPPARAPE